MVDCCIFVVLSLALASFLPFLFVYKSLAGRRTDGGQQADKEAVGIWSRELRKTFLIVRLFLFLFFFLIATHLDPLSTTTGG